MFPSLEPQELQQKITTSIATTENPLFINVNLGGLRIGFISCLVNCLKYGERDTLVLDGFYPYSQLGETRIKGIGTLALLKGIESLLKNGCVRTDYAVFHHPKRSPDAQRFLTRLKINEEGLILREYFNRACAYANERGFNFQPLSD